MYTLFKNDLTKCEFKRLRKAKVIAVDSEFIGLELQKDNLYLVQISSGDGNASLIQLSPKNNYDCPYLKKLMMDSNVQKIFHFARADMGVFKMNLDIDVKNVFCTKITSKVLRFDKESHSLRTLVKEICDVELSKEEQLSDWSLPKLTNSQLTYASYDVLYLHQIKDEFVKQLKERKLTKCLKKCFEFLDYQVELDTKGFQDINLFSHS